MIQNIQKRLNIPIVKVIWERKYFLKKNKKKNKKSICTELSSNWFVFHLQRKNWVVQKNLVKIGRIWNEKQLKRIKKEGRDVIATITIQVKRRNRVVDNHLHRQKTGIEITKSLINSIEYYMQRECALKNIVFIIVSRHNSKHKSSSNSKSKSSSSSKDRRSSDKHR